ncbi:MAG: VOC family protein, partial [Bacteroidales bacterium]|nr:VOC family protein [Bacteroidales bacterium]
INLLNQNFKKTAMATTNIYLNFNGNCEDAFNFYKSVFRIGFSYFSRFGQVPENDKYTASEAYKNKIMHVAIPIGQSILMGSDCGEENAGNFLQGNNFSVSVTADTKEEAERLFNGLAEGGQIIMPLNSTFWGDYFGMLTDKFGINWMVSFNEYQEQ